MLIYIVEDEPVIRRELKILLENAQYQVAAAEEFDEPKRMADWIQKKNPDLVLLDVTLPYCSGFDLCMDIREVSDVPVIFLTSRTSAMDELTGMLKGGDDYITKPYEPSLLLAHIGAVLKRTGKGKSDLLSYKNVSFSPARCSVEAEGKVVELTKTEMKILHSLFLHAGEFVSRTELMDDLWESHIFIDDNTLSVHVGRIREKLKGIGVKELIETKRGIGYRI